MKFMVILFDRFNLSSNIYEIIFSTKQQSIVAKALINFIKDNEGQINKSQMSLFATTLHNGELKFTSEETGKEVKLTYNKRQFYDRILTPLKSMGIIDYDLYKKTYILSDKFIEDMKKIGEMWIDELKKPTHKLGI